MSAKMKTDVIIVGAGPTGLSLACQLIRHGIDFVVVEKNESITPFSKALGVHARTLEIYEQLELAPQAVAQGTIAGKVRLLESGKVVGEVDLSNFGEGLSAYPYLLVLEQSENERLLYDYVQKHGHDVLWQHELESFSQDQDGVIASVKQSNGETQNIEGKYLVGCDGPKSPVRHGLGLSFEGSTFERLFYVADVRIDWKYDHDALHVCITEHGVVAFFPMPGDKRWRIVGSFPEGHNKDEGEVDYEEIEARIKDEAELELDITRVDWFSTYKVHTRHVERFSSKRGFLAGDSAHIHTPAGGQGMNTGIQDAYNLAWKLALVLKGAAAERILETYNEERLPNAKRLLQTTDRLFNLAAGTDWLVNVIRTTIFPPMAKFILSIDAVKKKFFPLVSQIGITYRDSSLSLHDGDSDFEVKAGDRLPYFLIDGKSVYDKLRAPKFHLLTFSDGQSDDQSVRDAIEANYPLLMDHYVIPLYPQVAEIFGTDKSFQVFLRPDNYIAFISPETSASRLASYLSEIIGQ
ncbi:MAG TPA: FAD-dependent monooxygenase [Pyrinomonadaceae bacterium]|jgi:2-polyprenyl-6-methoxyphenol hydroxylase-like FAD-dependent oxidoreductase|nr:FAD-dependent monooxygenase [Pyrinomonadaceae bacterium]